MRNLLIVAFLLGIGSACASHDHGGNPYFSSDPYMIPASEENGNLPEEAYSGDSMYIRKPVPNRSNPKPWEFYYKHCSTNGNEAYYSKTSYDCNGPYY